MVKEKTQKTLRQTMLEAGVVIAERDQLRLVAESISYAKVFNYLEKEYSVRVTRASVHERIWKSHNHFRQDVLNEAVNYFPTILPDERIVQIFESALRVAHGEPTIERRIDTFVRIVFGATGDIVLKSPARRHLQSAKAVSSRFNDPKATPTFPALLNDHLETVADTAIHIFTDLKTQLGIEADVGLGLNAETICHLAETLRSAIDCGAFLNSHTGSMAAIQPVMFKGVAQDDEYAWFPASIGQNLVIRHLHRPTNDDPTQPLEVETDCLSDPQTAGLPEQHVSDLKVRRQREELKQLVLAGGVDLLLNTASELRPASLTYANVFKHIKETTGTVIHRASVHKRIWETQEAFVLDVLDYSLTQVADGPLPDKDTAPPAELNTSTSSRRQATQDHIRLLSNWKATLFSESSGYRRLLLTKAAMFGKQDPEAVNSVRATIQRIDEEFVDTCKQLTKVRLLKLGFVVRPELGVSEEEALDIFGVLLLTVVTGLNFDRMAGVKSSFQIYKLPRVDQDSQTDDWPLEGVATWIFFDQIFIEID